MPDTHIAALNDLKDLVAALLADVQAVVLPPGADDRSDLRRQYVRASLAMAEGVCAAMRRIALADAEAGVSQFSLGQVTVLKGESYDLNDDGTVRARPSFHQTARSVRFSFAALAQTYGARHQMDVSTDGWRDFREAITIRNRLTHPKTPRDLVVSNQEIATVGRGMEWFRAQFEALAASILRTFAAEPEDGS